MKIFKKKVEDMTLDNQDREKFNRLYARWRSEEAERKEREDKQKKS